MAPKHRRAAVAASDRPPAVDDDLAQQAGPRPVHRIRVRAGPGGPGDGPEAASAGGGKADAGGWNAGKPDAGGGNMDAGGAEGACG